MKNHTSAIGAICIIFFIASQAFSFDVVPGEFLVQIKKSRSGKLKEFNGANFLNSYIKSQIVEENIVIIKRPIFESIDTSIELLSQIEDVELVEPNYIYYALGLPNDPLLENLWGLKNIGQADKDGQIGKPGVDIDVEKAWELGQGTRDVVIAVIDTGINYSFPDIGENLWTNSKELAGVAGVDDDKNGVIDDIFGAQFTSTENATFAAALGDPLDDHGHGSHCAGTIGALGNNSLGVVGVNWKTRIMGVKFLNKSGTGSLENAIRAINYAADMGADIMNNSWGGGPASELLKASIVRARDKGVLFVAAAGNNGSSNDVTATYPASYDVDNIISVAAIDNRGKLASFSNYGKNTVDVAAPGVNILSIAKTTDGKWEYDAWSGTSMATPHVTGVAALLKSQFPKMTYVEIKNRILTTVRPMASLRGKVGTGGLLNAFNAITNKTPEPDSEDPFYWSHKVHNVSSEHPYKSNELQEWTIEVPEANSFALYFEKISLEKGFDELSLFTMDGTLIQIITGDLSEVYSETIPGKKVRLVLKSDKSINLYGFDITKVSFK